MSIEVEIAGPDDESAWADFVSRADEATIFHLFGWRRVIKSVYGYEPCFLIARRGGDVAGVLPLIDVSSPLLGRNLISTAFTVGGGILAADSEAKVALAEAALAEGRRRRVGYVELRSRSAELEGWKVKNTVYANFEKPFSLDEEANLKETPRRRRAEVRKGLAAVEAGDLRYSFEGDLDIFYALYAQAMRDLGTPIFPKSFARALTREFADQSEILVIWAGDQPVLALLTFYFRDRVMPYYFGARTDAREHRAYDLAIWLQMRRGAERGARIFDFGRSRVGTGSFDYKAFWGFEPKPLEYQYALVGARETPNVNPNNPKFSAVSSAWKRLPLPLANFAGPIVARHFA